MFEKICGDWCIVKIIDNMGDLKQKEQRAKVG